MEKKWRSAAARRLKELAGTTTVEAATIEIGRRLTEGQSSPPITLDAIFPHVDIQRCYADDELSYAGELRPAEDGYEIAYCASESPTRRRFTIAHEIAHAVFERTGPHCPRRGRELEQICNLIASQILIPDDSLRKTVTYPLSLCQLSGLAARYETSLTSMVIRCAADFSLVAVEEENDELTWFNCPITADLVTPRVQLQKLTRLAENDATGSRRCRMELRRGVRDSIMEWTATGEDRRIFVFCEVRSG